MVIPPKVQKNLKRIEDIAKKRKVTEQEWLSYIWWRGKYDIEYFTDVFLRHDKYDKEKKIHTKSPKIHLELWEAIENEKLVNISYPRGFAKTTCIRHKLIHAICYKQYEKIIYLSAGKIAQKNLGKIKQEFQGNEKLIAIYGQLVPRQKGKDKGKVWRAEVVHFRNGVEMECATTRGTVRGNRADIIIIDDPQENKDVTTIEKCNEFVRWYTTTIVPILEKGCDKVLVLGTVVGERCFIKHLAGENGKRQGFKTLNYPAIRNIKIKNDPKLGKVIIGGDSIWDEYWDVQSLEKKRRMMYTDVGGDDFFWQEYMGIAMIVGGLGIFPKTWSYKRQKKAKPENGFLFFSSKIERNIGIGIDIAMGGDKNKNSDYLVMTGRNKVGKLLFQLRSNTITPLEAIKKLDWIYSRGYSGVFCPERNGIGSAFIQSCEDFCQREGREWFTQYIYREVKKNTITKQLSNEFGFLTTQNSKQSVISMLRETVLKTSQRLEGKKETKKGFTPYIDKWDVTPHILEEYMNFYQKENSKWEANVGFHDDTVMADALCLQALQQANSWSDNSHVRYID